MHRCNFDLDHCAYTRVHCVLLAPVAPQEAVAILSSPASMTQHLGNALEGLRYLVEPIDAANSECAVCMCRGGVC